MLMTQRDVNFVEPQDPTFSSSLTQRKIWEKEVDLFMQRKEDYQDNKHVIFLVALGQCSNTMKTQLKMNEDFEIWEDTFDVVSLLSEIQAISERFDTRTYFLEAYINAVTAFYCIQQGGKERINDYLSRFKKTVKVASHYGVSLNTDHILTKHELLLLGVINSLKDNIDDLEFDETELSEVASERLKAYIFVSGADKHRFKERHKSLKDSMALQQNMYPATLADAVSVLQKFELNNPLNNKEKDGQQQQMDRAKDNGQETKQKSKETEAEPREGVSLFQQENIDATSNDSTNQNSPDSEVQLLQQEIMNDNDDDQVQFLLTQIDDNIGEHAEHLHSENPQDIQFLLTQPDRYTNISRSWILLDSQSTCHVFNNRHLLHRIRTCAPGNEISIKSNGGGSLIINQIGDLPGVGEVYYHPHSIANVLSLSKMSKLYRITFDNSVQECFTVHVNNRQVKFVKSPKGLFYHDTSTVPKTKPVVVQTVKANEDAFTQRQVSQARIARRLHITLGRPSHADFIALIRSNGLKNCPIDVDDVNRSLQIYGQDIGSIWGKTVRAQPGHVLAPALSCVPPDILENHRRLQLCADVCYINNNPFLITITRHLKLRTVDDIKDTKDVTLLSSLRDVMKIYTSRGFEIEYVHADNGFRGLFNDLLPTRLNVAAAGEQVPEGERSIRTLKERTRAAIHGLPFKRHPTQLIVANVRYHNS